MVTVQQNMASIRHLLDDSRMFETDILTFIGKLGQVFVPTHPSEKESIGKTEQEEDYPLVSSVTWLAGKPPN